MPWVHELAHAHILMYEFKPFISKAMFCFCWGRNFNPAHYNWIPYLISPTNCQIYHISVFLVSPFHPPAPFNNDLNSLDKSLRDDYILVLTISPSPQGKYTMILNLWFLWKFFLKVKHKTEIICCLNATCWLVAEKQCSKKGVFPTCGKRIMFSFFVTVPYCHKRMT